MLSGQPFNVRYRTIQDCEDALTNWVSANAAVASKVSNRTRTLSQRRAARNRNAEGHDLAGQDAPLKDRESGLWVPAGAHREYQSDEEEEEEEEPVHAETRGREEEERTAVEA